MQSERMWSMRVTGLLGASCAWFGSLKEEPTIIHAKVTADGEVLSSWDDEAIPQCRWWNGTHQFDPEGHCSTFSVTRVGGGIAELATNRARRCAAAANTDCVLSAEIGLAIPAAFVVDDSDVTMMVAPRILQSESNLKTIRLQDPTGEHPNQLLEFNDTITIEYLQGGTRTMHTKTLQGNAAYCIQSLRRSIVDECWNAID